ncbi:MAG: ABC transporter ATP-binding protein [Actinobacteria bacterium]|nr:ABC transporter ATP-binding protein [Actinomycetota bacterium]
MTILETSGLSKRYGKQVVVDDLDLSVEDGELYGFLGPNGAGKSTTIRMALGLVFPSTGSIEVCGEPVFDGRCSGGSALTRVGALVEEPAFYGFLTGGRNLEYFVKAGPRSDRPERLGRIPEALKIVGLESAASKRVKAYSQGMRQRLGIARALLGAPDLLILDEPTNGLDPQGMREVRLLLRRLADEGTSVFVSSHLLGEVEAMCDRVGVLAEGRLVAQGSPSSLLGKVSRLRVDVGNRAAALNVLQSMHGVSMEDANVRRDASAGGSFTLRLNDGVAPADVNAALVASGIAVSALVPERERLEDAFIALTEDPSR